MPSSYCQITQKTTVQPTFRELGCFERGRIASCLVERNGDSPDSAPPKKILRRSQTCRRIDHIFTFLYNQGRAIFRA